MGNNISKKTLFFFLETIDSPFIPEEIRYISPYFEKIVLVPISGAKECFFSLPSNVKIDYSLNEVFQNRVILTKLGFKALFNKLVYKEILIFRNNPYKLLKAFWRTLKFEILSEVVSIWLKEVKFSNIEIGNRNSYVFYSFWLNAVIYGLCKSDVGTTCKIISRANGYDIYENRHKPPFFPFRDFYINRIDLIICASKSGSLHLQEKYPLQKDKILFSYLGIMNLNSLPEPKSIRKDFVIVSCSSVSDVKRVEKIALALSKISNINFSWYHIGSGPRLIFLRVLKIVLEKKNQSWHFLGYVQNANINKIYEKISPNLFINLSSSEGGVPVSIMEAARAGIPVLASQVGGNVEIIEDSRNGVLIDSFMPVNEISNKIQEIAQHKDILKYYAFNIRKTFENDFRAEDNYEKFIIILRNKNII